ncbi:MAG TPA: calcium-binding protein [Microvirga sp.]|jgi:Ca2+-binding RTX toxin-like protein|nr:calcium-binding protein [Microvirga sp.]
MALNNGKWKFGTAGDNHFDMIADQLNPFDVADNYSSGAGDDTVFGSFVDNEILLGSGNDWANGRWGNDSIYGGDNSDTIYGDAGIDWLYGQVGRDTLRGGDDSDHLFGGSENDELSGDDGVDALDGGTGSDKLYGGNDADKLSDGSSDGTFDVLDGGAGADTLTSSGGGDQMAGGSGSDLFSIGDGAAFAAAGGTISGGTETDTLVLRSLTDMSSFSFAMSIEKFNLQAASSQTLRFDFDEVRDLSSTDKLLIFGGSEDRIVLDNNVAGDALDGGRWVSGALGSPDSNGQQLQTWSYRDASGDYTGIEITLHSHIDVDLI